MQTEAEKYLILILKKILVTFSIKGVKPKMINLGAAKSTIIEDSIIEAGDFSCDRCDIQECAVDKPYAGASFVCPLEDMSLLADNNYDIAFANFVFEHIKNPEKAVRELARIVKPGGELVLSLSNPKAPEFVLAGLTPTSFHQLFRQEDHDEAYPVKYAYKSINNLIRLMTQTGWVLKEKKSLPATYSYLYRWPIIGFLSRAYDGLLNMANISSLMGHEVLHFSKIDKK